MESVQETVEKAEKFRGRLDFLDFTRGVIMMIMAWDHISGFWNEFHRGSEGILGRINTPYNTTWFLLRFVSHYCAPTFIFLAGTVQGPKDITDSATMGSAAAAKASVPLAKGKVELEPVVSVVELDKCDGCAMCVEPCAFKAISIEEHKEGEEVKKRAIVNEALCKGCGACAATCPPKAIYVKHFTLEQISAMIDVLLAE